MLLVPSRAPKRTQVIISILCCHVVTPTQHVCYTLTCPNSSQFACSYSNIVRRVLRRQHPWFTLHLPRYLAVMQADTIATAAQVGSWGSWARL